MATAHQVGYVSTVTAMYAEVKVKKGSEKIQTDQGTIYRGQRIGDFVKDVTDIFRIGDEVTFLAESMGNFTRVTALLKLKTLGVPPVVTHGYIQHNPEKAEALLITKEYGKLVFFQDHVVRTWNIPNDKSPFSDVCLEGYTARAKLFANPNTGWSVLSVMLLTPPDALESGYGIIHNKKSHAIIKSDSGGGVMMPHLRSFEPKGLSWTEVEGQRVHFFAVNNLPGFQCERVAIRAHLSSQCSLYHMKDYSVSVPVSPTTLGKGKEKKMVVQPMIVQGTRRDLDTFPMEGLKTPVASMESRKTMKQVVQTVEVAHVSTEDGIRQQLGEFVQEFRAALCFCAFLIIALFIHFAV